MWVLVSGKSNLKRTTIYDFFTQCYYLQSKNEAWNWGVQHP